MPNTRSSRVKNLVVSEKPTNKTKAKSRLGPRGPLTQRSTPYTRNKETRAPVVSPTPRGTYPTSRQSVEQQTGPSTSFTFPSSPPLITFPPYGSPQYTPTYTPLNTPPTTSTNHPQAINLDPIPETGNPFKEPVNLLPYFQSFYKGPFIIQDLQNSNEIIQQEATFEAVNACISLLKKRCKTLKLGRYKRVVLKNIAISLIETFPVLCAPGTGDARYVSISYQD